jgi:hypothetical protein
VVSRTLRDRLLLLSHVPVARGDFEVIIFVS